MSDSEVIGLLALVRRYEALLKKIEWDGAAHRPGMFCASCGGFQPTEGHPAGTTETMFNTTLHYGHREGCELAALIEEGRGCKTCEGLGTWYCNACGGDFCDNCVAFMYHDCDGKLLDAARREHYCHEWDGLRIHDGMPEFAACLCFAEAPQAPKKEVEP